MSPRILIPFVLLAIVVAGCGATRKPLAGTIPPNAQSAGRARIDDPRSKHLKCLRQHRISARRVGRTGIQIGSASGPTVVFEPTPGTAQGLELDGQVQGAEVIGSALLYPRDASDKQLKTIENCVAEGVAG